MGWRIVQKTLRVSNPTFFASLFSIRGPRDRQIGRLMPRLYVLIYGMECWGDAWYIDAGPSVICSTGEVIHLHLMLMYLPEESLWSIYLLCSLDNRHTCIFTREYKVIIIWYFQCFSAYLDTSLEHLNGLPTTAYIQRLHAAYMWLLTHVRWNH